MAYELAKEVLKDKKKQINAKIDLLQVKKQDLLDKKDQVQAKINACKAEKDDIQAAIDDLLGGE